MKLFKENSIVNLLPYDGQALYHGAIFSAQESRQYLADLLKSIDWKSDEGVLFGKRYVTKRKVAWYGDQGFNYGYSKKEKLALPWTSILLALKEVAEKQAGCAFNSCLLNLYHDGEEGMGWHSDNEKELAFEAPIASLSFGAERKFSFKHKQSKECKSILLENGSLLIMQGSIQSNWLHSLPKTKRVNTPRINLTFRQFAD